MFRSKKTGVLASTIGHPVLLQTTLDEEFLRRMTDAGFSRAAVTKAYVPENPETDWHPQIITNLGRRKSPPPPLPSDIIFLQPAPSKATFRPPSSVYSQPTPQDPVVQRFPRKQLSRGNIDLSPLSSPEMYSTNTKYRSRADEPVSPIDEDETEDKPTFPTAYQKTRLPPRSIPALGREKRNNEAAAAAANLQARRAVSETAHVTRGAPRKTSAAPKYNPYTGEPTKDEKGRAQSVKPSALSGRDRPMRVISDDCPVAQTVISSAAPKVQTSFADRLRKLRERNVVEEEQELPKAKAGWKGGSDRQPLLNPPTQPANTRAFSAPVKQAFKQGSHRREAALTAHKLGAMYISYDESSLDTITPPPLNMHPALRDKRISDNDTSFGTEDSMASSVGPLQLLPKQYLSDEEYKQLRKTDEKMSHKNPQSASDLHDISVGVVERNFREALKESKLASKTKNYHDEPPSRFSETTYDPSTYAASTRPSRSHEQHHGSSSPEPPLPDDAALTILNRRHPRVNSAETLKSLSVPVRKPVGNAAIPPTPSIIATTPTTPSSTQKDLPLDPAEIAAKSQDKCVMLQAKLDALARRRQNLEKSIHQMTELMPVDGALGGIGGALIGGGNMRRHVVGTADVSWTGDRSKGRTVMAMKFTEKRREEEKFKVEELKSELADVRKAEYEVGLRLHRAWKRKDESAVYEPTTLWVRRITG